MSPHETLPALRESTESRTAAPIFVVGVPRSGTTLLTAMLSAHSRLSSGPETSFFLALRRADLRRLLSPATWPRPAVEFLCGISLGGQPVFERFGLAPQEIRTFLERGRPAVSSMLCAFTVPYMQRAEKARWIEKSPMHLLHIRDLRRHFPDCRVIRIVRDPRDVALSLTRVPWGAESFEDGLLYWRAVDDRSRQAVEADRGVLTVRYEDLLLEPESNLRQICEFLGESFEESMLDTSGSYSDVARSNETWKSKVAGPIDPARLDVWQRELSEEQRRVAIAILGDRLRAHGYRFGADGETDTEIASDGGAPGRFVRFHPLNRSLARHATLLGELARRNRRLWPAGDREQPELAVFVGHPDRDDWLGHERWGRVRTAIRLAGQIAALRWRGGGVFWLRPPHEERIGLCGRLVGSSLRCFGRRVDGHAELLEAVPDRHEAC